MKKFSCFFLFLSTANSSSSNKGITIYLLPLFRVKLFSSHTCCCRLDIAASSLDEHETWRTWMSSLLTHFLHNFTLLFCSFLLLVFFNKLAKRLMMIKWSFMFGVAHFTHRAFELDTISVTTTSTRNKLKNYCYLFSIIGRWETENVHSSFSRRYIVRRLAKWLLLSKSKCRHASRRCCCCWLVNESCTAKTALSTGRIAATCNISNVCQLFKAN